MLPFTSLEVTAEFVETPNGSIIDLSLGTTPGRTCSRTKLFHELAQLCAPLLSGPDLLPKCLAEQLRHAFFQTFFGIWTIQSKKSMSTATERFVRSITVNPWELIDTPLVPGFPICTSWPQYLSQNIRKHNSNSIQNKGNIENNINQETFETKRNIPTIPRIPTIPTIPTFNLLNLLHFKPPFKDRPQNFRSAAPRNCSKAACEPISYSFLTKVRPPVPKHSVAVR